jgi:lysozyme
MFNGVIDLSHHVRSVDWRAARAAGIAAVIHKASEGATFRDPVFASRREEARAAGLLWGSYHYASGADVEAQVEAYLAYAAPAPDELICLDYEKSSSGADMTLDQAGAFVELVGRRTGRRPVLYGGTLLRERLAAETTPRPDLARCPLWHARYADAPQEVPAGWERWTLWQYTDGFRGPEPREVDGVGPVDRSLFDGTEAEFRRRWPFWAGG